MAADAAAVKSMRSLNEIISGRIVIGEGEDEAPMLLLVKKLVKVALKLILHLTH